MTYFSPLSGLPHQWTRCHRVQTVIADRFGYSSFHWYDVHAIHRLHFSSGSSDVSLPNPRQVPSLSLPALPIFCCMLHAWIRFSILHSLQVIFFPTVHPLLLAYSAAHPLLTPLLSDLQPITHLPQISQYTSVSTFLVIAIYVVLLFDMSGDYLAFCFL